MAKKKKNLLLVYSISSEFSLPPFLELVSLMPPLHHRTIWFLDFVHVVSLRWTLIYWGLECGQSSVLASTEKSGFPLIP